MNLMRTGRTKRDVELPAQYPYVADDVIKLCRPRAGVQVDVGAGSGGLGLALAARSRGSIVILVDPDGQALQKALESAQKQGLESKIVTIAGRAEEMPLADGCADLVVSRGSIFFWSDRVQGLREAWRILRPKGKAMIGGGLGTSYPGWARREFARRRREGVRKEGPEAVRHFEEMRKAEIFRRWALEAGIRDFEVSCEEELGIWLRFAKGGTL